MVESSANGLTSADVARFRSDLNTFGAEDVGFVATWHVPVLSILHPLAVAFLVANVIAIALLFAKLFVRRRWRTRSRRMAVWSVVFLPALAALLWWFIVPENNDRTPYKRGVRAELAQQEPDAPVLYETVIWPPVPFSYDEIDQDRKFARPEVFGIDQGERRSPWDGPHWLGTDKIGRDILSRMLWGGRISLSVGLVAVGLYVAIGVIVGSVAGFFRGWVDMLISRVIEVVIVFPTFFLILTIVAFVGPSLMNIMIVIGLTGWTGVARLVRGEFLRLADQEFVIAGRALGYSAPQTDLPTRFAERIRTRSGGGDVRRRGSDPDGKRALLPGARHHDPDTELGRHPRGRSRDDGRAMADLPARLRDLHHDPVLQPCGRSSQGCVRPAIARESLNIRVESRNEAEGSQPLGFIRCQT